MSIWELVSTAVGILALLVVATIILISALSVITGTRRWLAGQKQHKRTQLTPEVLRQLAIDGEAFSKLAYSLPDNQEKERALRVAFIQGVDFVLTHLEGDRYELFETKEIDE